MQLTSLVALVLAASASLALPAGPARRSAWAALPMGALALASLAAAGGGEWRAALLPRSFLAVSGGLWLIGLLVPVLAVARALTARRLGGPAAGWAGVAGGAALVAGGATTIELVRGGGWLAGVAAMALLAAGAGGGLLARRTGMADRCVNWDRRFFGGGIPSGGMARGPSQRLLWWGHVAAALLALLVPHLLVLFGATLVTVVLGTELERRRPGAGRWPWSATLGLAGTGLGGLFLLQAAGELPLSLSALRDGPFSPAFELTVVPVLACASWPLVRLFPFHRAALGPLTPVAGAALWLAVAGPLLPGGVQHWQPVLFPLVGLSVWYAAATRDLPLALSGLGMVGLVAGPGPAGLAGAALVTAAAALRAGRDIGVPILRPVLGGLVCCVAVAAAPTALAGGLLAETFYTVVVAAGVSAAAGGRQG